mgnify:CR=1 FL=1
MERTMSQKNFVELRNVTKRFGSNMVIDNINLTIPQGQMVTLLGPSGCGTNSFYRTGRFYIPVLADIEMITRSVESSSAMTDVQVIFCETLVFARSGAMDYYQVYSSHEWIK